MALVTTFLAVWLVVNAALFGLAAILDRRQGARDLGRPGLPAPLRSVRGPRP